MPSTFRGVAIAALIFGSGLAGGIEVPEGYREMTREFDIVEHPGPAKFSVCYRHGCAGVTTISLDAGDWQEIVQIFAKPAPSAAAERARIAQAVASLEQLVGPLSGTADDRGGNLAGMWAGGNQMDCIDESTNTTTYLTLLQQAGLLTWHRVEGRSTRGFIIFGWPHTTAVVSEIDSEKRWVVDSWFHDNGTPPEILPLVEWKAGWSPEGFAGF
jgi:hypothetical protein